MGLGLTQQDYEQMLSDFYYQNSPYYKYGAKNFAATNSLQSSNTDATSIFNDKQNTNTCTDGSDDGKIGFLAAAGNFIEGGVKGIWNGLKSCVTGKDGKFSLLKTLGTVAIGAACIAFPVVGAVACGVGIAAGAVNVAKGAVAASKATTDAEAKAAWETMGDGTFTAVGSAVGMKASVGAMKSASMASKLGNVDDAMKALGNTDDAIASMSKADKISTILKSKGYKNTDEILNAIDDLDNVDDIMKVVKEQGQLDDAIKISDKLKSLGDDAVTSSKAGAKKVWTKAKTGKEALDYQTAKHKQTKTQQDLDDATKALDKMRSEGASADKIAAQKEKIYNLEEQLNTLNNEVNARGGFLSDDAAKVVDKMDDIQNSTKNYRNNVADKVDDVKTAKELLADAKKSGNKADIDAGAELVKEARKAKNEAIKQPLTDAINTVTDNSQTAQAIKNTINNTVKTPEGRVQIFKSIQKNCNLDAFKNIANGLGADALKIYNFIKKDTGTYAEAVQQFGYNNVLEVLKMFGGVAMTNDSI